MKKNKIYGYMVGYRELGSRFTRYYTDFTYTRALSSLLFYRKFPPCERETNRPLIDPVWEIQPITKKAILKSILDEIPFLCKKRHLIGDVLYYSWSLIHCNNSSYCIFPSAKRKPTSTTSSSVASSGIPFTSKNVNKTYIPIRLFPSTKA